MENNFSNVNHKYLPYYIIPEKSYFFFKTEIFFLFFSEIKNRVASAPLFNHSSLSHSQDLEKSPPLNKEAKPLNCFNLSNSSLSIPIFVIIQRSLNPASKPIVERFSSLIQ